MMEFVIHISVNHIKSGKENQKKLCMKILFCFDTRMTMATLYLNLVTCVNPIT